jgi:hypothetical protein
LISVSTSASTAENIAEHSGSFILTADGCVLNVRQEMAKLIAARPNLSAAQALSEVRQSAALPF